MKSTSEALARNDCEASTSSRRDCSASTDAKWQEEEKMAHEDRENVHVRESVHERGGESEGE